MNPIALVTANFGSIDAMKPLPPHPMVDAFYYTDQRGLTAEGWDHLVHPDYPRHDFTPRLRAKYFKQQPHRLPEVERYPYLAWADSTLQFSDLRFLAGAHHRLSALPAHQRLLMVPHPDRNTVGEEYAFLCAEMAKGNEYLRVRYETEKMAEQMADFARRGWSPNAKLWCGGIFLFENAPTTRAWLNDWWDQSVRFGIMDQLPLPHLLALHGLEPTPLPVNVFNNEHFRYIPHQRAM
jgi:hypothetical protein